MPVYLNASPKTHSTPSFSPDIPIHRVSALLSLPLSIHSVSLSFYPLSLSVFLPTLSLPLSTHSVYPSFYPLCLFKYTFLSVPPLYMFLRWGILNIALGNTSLKGRSATLCRSVHILCDGKQESTA